MLAIFSKRLATNLVTRVHCEIPLCRRYVTYLVPSLDSLKRVSGEATVPKFDLFPCTCLIVQPSRFRPFSCRFDVGKRVISSGHELTGRYRINVGMIAYVNTYAQDFPTVGRVSGTLAKNPFGRHSSFFRLYNRATAASGYLLESTRLVVARRDQRAVYRVEAIHKCLYSAVSPVATHSLKGACPPRWP